MESAAHCRGVDAIGAIVGAMKGQTMKPTLIYVTSKGIVKTDQGNVVKASVTIYQARQ